MSSRFILPFADVGSGLKPSSGAQLFFFATGTSTEKDTFSDLAATTPNANPVIANAVGVFPDIFITGTYKVVLKDKNNVQEWEADPIIEATSGNFDTNLINDLSQAYTFKTVALMQASLIVFPIGKKIFWQGYHEESDGGSNWGLVQAGTGIEDGGSEFDLADGKHVAANMKSARVRVKQFGAYGDFGNGDHDDTLAIQAALDYALANGSSVKFTSGDYVVSDKLLVSVNTVFDSVAVLHPVGMVAGQIVFSIIARTEHVGVIVVGDVAVDPANGTIGIAVIGTLISSSRVQLTNCTALRCDYGILLGTFSVMLTNCKSNSNNVNLGMYAPSTNQEINDINVIGGNYGEPLGDYSVDIGIDALTPVAKGSPQGTRLLLQGFAVDGGSVRVNGIDNITLDNVYFEVTKTGKCIELGHVGFDGGTNVVTIRGCRFKSAEYGVYCFSGVRDIHMSQSNNSAITKSALYMSTDLYGYNYKGGYNAGSFDDGQEVHTGQRALSSYPFGGNKSIDIYGLLNGDTVGSTVSTHVYKNRVSQEIATKLTYLYGGTTLSWARHRTVGNGASKTGTVAGNVITFVNQSDIQPFNGGDGIMVGAVFAIVRIADYDAKTLLVNPVDGAIPTGAQTITQTEVTPIISGIAASTPTRTDGGAGSMLQSTNAGQAGWVFQSGAWQSF